MTDIENLEKFFLSTYEVLRGVFLFFHMLYLLYILSFENKNQVHNKWLIALKCKNKYVWLFFLLHRVIDHLFGEKNNIIYTQSFFDEFASYNYSLGYVIIRQTYRLYPFLYILPQRFNNWAFNKHMFYRVIS